MADQGKPAWIRLAGASCEAAKAGQWQRANELGGAALEAWYAHCDQVEGQMLGKRLAHRHKVAREDWEFFRDLDKSRGR